MGTTDAERWRRVEELCEQALARDPGERDSFLAAACGADRELRREVESLLANEAKAESFLQSSTLAAAIHGVMGPPRAVSAGRRIGVYEIGPQLGVGGMGEVYRARDTQLGRDVAIKVLPAAFVTDRERLARFEREARLLASLNHPHIGAIYGVENVDGVRALVLELVEGDTLDARLKGSRSKGPMEREGFSRAGLPVLEALTIARQIAEALEAAHEKGIVHRDLKPANIKITPAGVVKVLDFGLAKAGEGGAADLSHSPTVTVSGPHEGVLLGTVAYMSPEQARGQSVDKRTDIWAFGCVLYEMLIGRAAFSGETVSDHIAAILEREPNWSALPATTPPVLQRLLRRCLEKDPKRRLHDIADARIELDELVGASTSGDGRSREDVTARRGVRGWLQIVAISVTASALTALVGWTAWKVASSRESPVARSVTRFVLQPPAEAPMVGDGFDISPDGRQVVYEGLERGVRRLYLRRLDQFAAAALAGTDGAFRPFFSPDGQWIGFAAGGKLKKISVTSTASPIVLCDAPAFLGATWASDDTITFANIKHGVQRVSAEGGEPSMVTTVGQNPREEDHHSPELLPGGRALLFAIHEAENRFSITVQSLASGQRKVVIDSGFDAQYSFSGHIVYARGSTILAVPFDLNRLFVTGAPVTLVEQVATSPRDGVGGFQLSRNGSLVFEPERSLAGRVLTWVDHSGKEVPLTITSRSFTHPSLAPDGKRLAFVAADGDRHDIWIYEFAGDKLTRETSEGDNQGPLWTSDGQRLTYASRRDGKQQLMWQPADGSARPESLLAGPNLLWPGAWTPDSRTLVYLEQPPTDDPKAFVLRLDGDPRTLPLMPGRVQPRVPRLSPDGRWLAYASRETGRAEVYVESFPASGSRQQVTSEGGREPVWSRDGRELFYRLGTRVFAAQVNTTRAFSATKPVMLFEGRYVVDFLNGVDYDVAPDGRFLLMKPSEEEQAPPRLNVVLNWVDELTRRVPSGKSR